MQVGFKKHGRSGIEVTDWWPHLAGCVDDMAFVRSMYTTDAEHSALEQQGHRHQSSRNVADGFGDVLGEPPVVGYVLE